MISVEVILCLLSAQALQSILHRDRCPFFTNLSLQPVGKDGKRGMYFQRKLMLIRGVLCEDRGGGDEIFC